MQNLEAWKGTDYAALITDSIKLGVKQDAVKGGEKKLGETKLS